ncbi:MAG: protein arginine kinase [Clostridiales bacterium]|nr:protein arginine kinase [Clostridiales bacterium]
MKDIQNGIVVTSRVRLARNYHDLPFSNLENPDNAQTCINRAKLAFEGRVSAATVPQNPVSPSQSPEAYTLYTLKTMNSTSRMALVEQHLISRDLLQNSQIGAALIRGDQTISIMINEEDHLRIQAMLSGLQLQEAASQAFEAEETLEKQCAFSFDHQWGYLTACPTNTGTGMRASLMLHLPMLTFFKQMGNVTQSVAKLGLTIRGIYGEGSEALGDLYQVSNQVTLGRTEKEIIDGVIAVGTQLIDMEQSLRQRAVAEASLSLQDRVLRSYGLLRYARQMDANEFMEHWSKLRLGCALSLLPVPLSVADSLLTIAQDAHAKRYRANKNPSLSTDQARSEIIRSHLNPTPQEV